MQTSPDNPAEQNDYVANKNAISLPRASIKYSKVKQSVYCPDTISINIIGRDQVKMDHLDTRLVQVAVICYFEDSLFQHINIL